MKIYGRMKKKTLSENIKKWAYRGIAAASFTAIVGSAFAMATMPRTKEEPKQDTDIEKRLHELESNYSKLEKSSKEKDKVLEKEKEQKISSEYRIKELEYELKKAAEMPLPKIEVVLDEIVGEPKKPKTVDWDDIKKQYEEARKEPVAEKEWDAFKEKCEKAKQRAIELSKEKDAHDGKVYSLTLADMEDILKCNNVAKPDKKHIQLLADSIRQGYRPQKGWEPIAYKKLKEYCDANNKDPDKLQYQISFVEGGPYVFQISVKDNGINVFTHQKRYTPNSSIGDIENILIRALKAAGY
ncbi:hypothetical protein KY311_04055 [Candidatus Woesearchaeota archaeon]|nr:hypothetical protein [Candidatus Woesearchaeota archaeon]